MLKTKLLCNPKAIIMVLLFVVMLFDFLFLLSPQTQKSTCGADSGRKPYFRISGWLYDDDELFWTFIFGHSVVVYCAKPQVNKWHYECLQSSHLSCHGQGSTFVSEVPDRSQDSRCDTPRYSGIDAGKFCGVIVSCGISWATETSHEHEL